MTNHFPDVRKMIIAGKEEIVKRDKKGDMEHNYKGLTQELRQAVADIKTAILQSQARAARMISGSQLSLFFGVGLYVSANSREGTWGTGAIDSISSQLHRELPGLRGFSSQNIRNMRQFAEFWQPYLYHSPMASKLAIKELGKEIEYDRFALAKWSPMTSEINRDEFLGYSFSTCKVKGEAREKIRLRLSESRVMLVSTLLSVSRLDPLGQGRSIGVG